MDPQYPSDNWLDIPVLELGMQPAELTLPILGWGTVRRSTTMPDGGTWHCYVDDYRFARLWERPDGPVETAAGAIVEPNYSIYVETPLPVALWHVYRKRWLARYWGERGMGIWVDLNVASTYSGLNLVGVPQGWGAFFTRGYEERIEDLSVEYALARERAGAPPRFVVYAGGEKVRELCQSRGWTYVDDHNRAVGRQLRELERHGKR